MGEVYRATDTKLDRDVAIKVLPPAFAQDKERLARFEREAKALAQLNHPNIASVYGFDQHDGTWFLVMENVDGEDLSQCLKRGALPVDECINICRQIAEGLEAAHAKGIIHRDLKPANIRLDSEGKVKVLDFGLAKAAVGSAVPSGLADANAEEVLGTARPTGVDSDSPTITADFTRPGAILGTAAYMSPEQARGKPLDHRTDIWSFGCVLFECLTGSRTFGGEDASETLVNVLREDPDWSALPKSTPLVLRLLLRKCLAKESRCRLRDIGDARIDLDPSTSEFTQSALAPSLEIIKSNGGSLNRTPWVVAIMLTSLLGASLAWWFKPTPSIPSPSMPQVRHLSLDFDVPDHIAGAGGVAARLSPDGSMIAFMAGNHFPQFASLYIRRLDELEPLEIETAKGVVDFCFSPDGREIAFRQGGSDDLKAVLISGGNARKICRSGRTMGIDWKDSQSIVYAAGDPDGSRNGVLFRVSAQGGDPDILAQPDNDETSYRHPFLLPKDDVVIFTETSIHAGVTESRVMALPISHGEPIELVDKGMDARFIAPDRLIYSDLGTLISVAFDPDELEIHGRRHPVLEKVARSQNDTAHYDVLPEGPLIYLRGGQLEELWDLWWVDRDGTKNLAIEGEAIQDFAISPLGNHLIYSVRTASSIDLILYDLVRRSRLKLNRNSGYHSLPKWNPDGNSVVFKHTGNGEINSLMWQSIVGATPPVEVLSDFRGIQTYEWHPDGDSIVLAMASGELKFIAMDQSAEENPTFRETPNSIHLNLNVREFALSPNGNWLAFSSDDGDSTQVYLRAFPDGDELIPVSIEALMARNPMWSLSRNELLYWAVEKEGESFSSQVITVGYKNESDRMILEPAKPWPGAIPQTHYTDSDFAPAPEGQRVLIRRRNQKVEEDLTYQRIYMINNIGEFVRRKMSDSTE